MAWCYKLHLHFNKTLENKTTLWITSTGPDKWEKQKSVVSSSHDYKPPYWMLNILKATYKLITAILWLHSQTSIMLLPDYVYIFFILKQMKPTGLSHFKNTTSSYYIRLPSHNPSPILSHPKTIQIGLSCIGLRHPEQRATWWHSQPSGTRACHSVCHLYTSLPQGYKYPLRLGLHSW